MPFIESIFLWISLANGTICLFLWCPGIPFAKPTWLLTNFHVRFILNFSHSFFRHRSCSYQDELSKYVHLDFKKMGTLVCRIHTKKIYRGYSFCLSFPFCAFLFVCFFYQECWWRTTWMVLVWQPFNLAFLQFNFHRRNHHFLDHDLSSLPMLRYLSLWWESKMMICN
jgi:hypothetical protein